MKRLILTLMLATVSFAPLSFAASSTPDQAATQQAPVTVHYRTAAIAGVNIFYREAGPKDGPVVVLLHGFPTSSHMFRNLIPLLADRYRVIAPDYPGFGQSDAPDHTKFVFSFGHYADLVDGLLDRLGAKKYSMYVMDYGAPVG
ncbi:alpha/beta fold hydrolase, partial [Rhizobium sp. SEMIA 4085]